MSKKFNDMAELIKKMKSAEPVEVVEVEVKKEEPKKKEKKEKEVKAEPEVVAEEKKEE